MTLKVEDAKKEYLGMYRAKVLDNNDPKQYGRIKAQVYPFMSTLLADMLPWAAPAMPIFEGAGYESGAPFGAFVVPKVGTVVFVFFEGGDVRLPVYFAEAQTATYGLPLAGGTSYPHRKVWRTKNGIEMYIDDTLQEVKLQHPTGTYIVIDGQGNIHVHSVKDILLDEDAGSYIKLQDGGEIMIHGAGKVTIESDVLVDVNP